MMKRFTLSAAIACFAIAFTCVTSLTVRAADAEKSTKASETKAVDTSKRETTVKLAPDRTVVCYFHRTNRCPTCQKVGNYVEESVKKGFASEIKAGRVEVMQIDFQDPKNQKLTEAYKIAGPTLIMLKVRGDKVVEWKPAPKAWSYVAKQDDFFKYVQGEVRAYSESK